MKRTLNILVLIAIGAVPSFIATPLFSQTVSDIDGNIYPTVILGSQEWMAENLKTTRFNNGDLIPHVELNDRWESTEDPAWSWYNNNNFLDQLYGKLYNGHVVLDERNVCPEGWHIPTDADWRTMLHTLCDTENCEEVWFENQPQSGWTGTDEGGKIKSTNYWNSPNTGANNSSGLTVLPGGYRYFDGNFYTFGEYTNIWTSTMRSDSVNMWFWAPINNRADIYHGYGDPNNGQSIRCMRDAVTGIGSQQTKPLHVHPNPGNNVLWLSLPEHGIYELTLYNSKGQIVRTETFSSTRISVDVADVPVGIYLVQVRSENTLQIARWIKQ